MLKGAGRWYALSGLIVLADQISKAVVLDRLALGEIVYFMPFWNWVLTYNPGAAFSFLADQAGWQRWFFTALALGVAAWIAVLLREAWRDRPLALALSLIMGGALGNVIDRIRFGAVVDFVQWHAAGFHWPAFNIADAAICLGAVLVIGHQLFSGKKS